MNSRFINFTFSIMKLNKLVNRIKLVEMKEFGLKAIHVMCAYSIYVHGEMTASELIRFTLEDKAAISRALKLLLEKGFVTYNSDGYNSPVALTKEGTALAVAIEEKAERAVDAAGGTFTAEQRRNLYECLDTVCNRLEAYYKSISEDKTE